MIQRKRLLVLSTPNVVDPGATVDLVFMPQRPTRIDGYEPRVGTKVGKCYVGCDLVRPSGPWQTAHLGTQVLLEVTNVGGVRAKLGVTLTVTEVVQ